MLTLARVAQAPVANELVARWGLELEADLPIANFLLGATYAARAMYPVAVAPFQATLPLGNEYLGWLGYARARAGNADDANRLLDEIKDLRRRGRGADAADVARVHIGLGQKDRAFEWLSKALDERAVFVAYLKVDLSYEILRSDARYAALLQRLGLPD